MKDKKFTQLHRIQTPKAWKIAVLDFEPRKKVKKLSYFKFASLLTSTLIIIILSLFVLNPSQYSHLFKDNLSRQISLEDPNQSKLQEKSAAKPDMSADEEAAFKNEKEIIEMDMEIAKNEESASTTEIAELIDRADMIVEATIKTNEKNSNSPAIYELSLIKIYKGDLKENDQLKIQVNFPQNHLTEATQLPLEIDHTYLLLLTAGQNPLDLPQIIDPIQDIYPLAKNYQNNPRNIELPDFSAEEIINYFQNN